MSSVESALKINSLNKEQAEEELSGCCGSKKWTEIMMKSFPYDSEKLLLQKAEATLMSLSESDCLEAFAHHSKIGDIETLKKKFSSAENEQAGVKGTTEEILKELKLLNDEYERKFGFIFIVFASGKSADEMLSILKSRIKNDRETEVRNARDEQIKITKLRLKKLI